MEMTGLWKAWKAQSRLPPLSTSPLGISPKGGEIPTAPAKWSGKVENQNQVSHFPLPLRDHNCGLVFSNPGSFRLPEPPLGGGERSDSPASGGAHFQDHLVLESKLDFRIILRLENAAASPPKARARNAEVTLLKAC